MPGRDDYRSNREYEEYERRRREMDRDPQRRMGGAERRSFENRGRFNSDEARYGAQNQRDRLGDYPGATGDAEAWRAERAGSRYDQDRAHYGWRQEPRPVREEREPWRSRGPDEPGYGGQEYGIEAHHDDFDRSSSIVQRSGEGGGGRRLEERFGQDDRGDPPFRGDPRASGAGHVNWRDDGGPYGDSHLDRQDRAMQEFGVPHDYGFHPHDDEFEPHYTHWRDEQMRRHDEEYRQWRTQQLRQYDEDYRAWRGERRESFGQTFSQWRSQRSNLTRGTPDTGVAPGVTAGASFGAKQTSFGTSQAAAPSGAHEAEPTGKPAAGAGSEGQTGASGDEVGFAQVSPAVQKATDGQARGDTRENDNGREGEDGKGRS